jgi:hypothetical protein
MRLRLRWSLFLVGIPRITLDIVIRALAIAKVRGCGWWIMGAFWGTLFQVVVAPVQWAVARGHTISKKVTYQMAAEAARLEIEDAEAQRLSMEEASEPTAPRAALYNLDRLVNWSNELLGRRDNDWFYAVPIVRNKQIMMGDLAGDRDAEHEINRGGQPHRQ